MNIESWSIEKVKPYENNPRKNNAVEKVAASIEEFGWQQPIVVDKSGTIIAGHTRYGAAKLLELKEVPVVVADLSDELANAYRIADNRTNEDSLWDFAKLTEELTKLKDADLDLEPLGFEKEELESMLTLDTPDVDWLKTEDHWKGMPTYEHNDQKPARSLYVHFPDDESVKKFTELAGATITDKTKYIWFPPVELNRVADLGYVNEEE